MSPETQPTTTPGKMEHADVFQKAITYTRAREARATGYYPYFIPIEGSEGTEVVIDGHPVVMLGSNNYLGLTHDRRVLEAGEKASRTYGAGCTGSRFLNGTLDLHLQLEAELAEFVGKEAALVFSTGYQTNLGSISALVGRNDFALLDKLDHACIVDGAQMSMGQGARFRTRESSSRSMACSPWKATSLPFPKSSNSRMPREPESWWTKRTRSECWGLVERGSPSTSALVTRPTSSWGLSPSPSHPSEASWPPTMSSSTSFATTRAR